MAEEWAGVGGLGAALTGGGRKNGCCVEKCSVNEMKQQESLAQGWKKDNCNFYNIE